MRAVIFADVDEMQPPASNAAPTLSPPYARVAREALRLYLDATAPLEFNAEERALAAEWLADLDIEHAQTQRAKN